MLETTISNFIEQQFPQIYQEEGPFFIEFMKQYYVWLETDPTSPIYQARHHVTNHDIDGTVDNFLIFFKEKYLKNIQINTATNTKQLIKNSIDLYRSKGTENAIKLFFDLIFSAESEVYYPGNDVFRLSNAEWVIPYYLEVTSKPINRLMVGRAIVGVDSGATAFVEKLVRRKIKNNYVEIIYISAVSGQFRTGEIVKLSVADGTPFEAFPNVLGSLTSLEVVDGGTGFAKGDIVKLTSRSGDQGRGLVSDLQSITGIVDFTLQNGGWGYTVNTNINVSDKVLVLSNVSITSSANMSLNDKIINIVQPMANVQWYANTSAFGVGNTVYNYYANGVLIGVNTIISAEYGTSNTTNFFLLNTISGNNFMDPALPRYYTAGNTANFQVQNAGWANNTANGTAVGDISSNVVMYCTGNSQSFSVNQSVYQISNTNNVYVRSRIKNITPVSSSVFTMEVDNLEGLFLTNQKLYSTSSNGSADITSLSYAMGVRAVTGSFKNLPGNRLKDTANTSLWHATLDQISFGAGANTNFNTDLLYPQTIQLNTNYVRDHIDETNQANWVNAASYGAALNTANLTNKTLALALMFQTKTLGMISRLENENPGQGYSYAPFVEAVDVLVAPYNKMDFVIRYNSTTGVFALGEEVTQVINGAKGLVKFANTSEVHVRRLTFEDRWTVGNSANSYLMIGTSSGFSAYPTEVTADIEGIAGKNAVISTKVASSNSAVATLNVTDSGFAFRHDDDVEFTSLDDLRSGNAKAAVVTAGRGSGFYKTTSGFLSTNKYLYDGDYYQDFSYEIRSPVSVGRYADMLKSVLHVAGTKVFSSIMKNTSVDASSKMNASIYSVADTAWLVYNLHLNFKNSTYYQGGFENELNALSGYSYTRTGAKGEINALSGIDRVDDFAANVPAVIDGIGYFSRPALTNINIQSQDLSAAAWIKDGTSVTANAIVAPNGTTTADTLSASPTTAEHRAYISHTASAGAIATKSILAKAGTAGFISLGRGLVTSPYAVFNLTTGVVSASANGGTGYIVNCGGGWYRCILVGASTGDFTVVNIGTTAANAAPQQGWLGAGETVHLWQGQTILGSLPDGGPIIVTTTATVAVGVDDLRMTNQSITEVDQVFECTLDTVSLVNGTTLFGALIDGNNGFYVRQNAGVAQIVSIATVGGVTVVSNALALTTGRVALIVRRKAGKFTLAVRQNGTTSVSPDTTTPLTVGTHQFHFGALTGGGHTNAPFEFFGHRKITASDAYLTSRLLELLP